MKEFLKNKVQVIITSVFAVILLTLSIVGGITISNLNNQINDLNNQIENMNKVDEDLDSYIDNLEAELNTIKTNLNSTNTKINELEVAFGTDIDEAEESILNELNNVKTSLETELDEISTLIEELTNKDSALESRISSLETSVNNLNATLEALTNQVNQNAEDIKALEDIIAGLEIRVNCLEGNHELDISYTWSEDYNEATAEGYCAYCNEELHETVTTTYSDGVVSADFSIEYFEDQSVVLTDTLNMTANELKRSLMKLVSEDETNIVVELQKDASEELFYAIREGISNTTEGSINLTITGSKNIKSMAFLEVDSLKSISIPDATTIGDSAFSSCTSLESVNAPKVIDVGQYAFEYCTELSSINFPLTETIGANAFYEAKLQSIYLPNVTSIGDNALFNSIESPQIILGTPVIHFGASVFNYGVELVVAKGQKNFTGNDIDGWTITDEDVPTGENVIFLGCTFKSINIYVNEFLVSNSNELLEAIEKAKITDITEKTATIRLMNDIEVETEADENGYADYAILIETGNIIIDLNGYTLFATNYPSYIIQIGTELEGLCDAVITIEDNSTAKTGKIFSRTCGIINLGGELIINDGTIEVTNTNDFSPATGIVFFSGSVTINGGTVIVTSTAQYRSTQAIYEGGNGGTFTMNGGYINAHGPDLEFICLCGTSYINGGIIQSNGGYIYCIGTIYLGTNEEGIGATFVGGIKFAEVALNTLLVEGVGYYDANGNLIEIADDVKEITDKGDITVKRIN